MRSRRRWRRTRPASADRARGVSLRRRRARERAVVNLINRLPADAYRHAIVALTEITDFRSRVLRDDVSYVALRKRPGHGCHAISAARPSVPAARTRHRAHAQPGGAGGDGAGLARRRAGARARRARSRRRRPRRHQSQVPAHPAAVPSIRHPLRCTVERPASSICASTSASIPRGSRSICNGVDTAGSSPAMNGRAIAVAARSPSPTCGGSAPSVGMQTVKDQVTLAHAFVRARKRRNAARRMRLVIVGDGPLRASVEGVLATRLDCAICLAPRRARRRRRDPARPRLLRAAVARRGHFEHDPRGDGVRITRRRDARRRQLRTGRRRRHRAAGSGRRYRGDGWRAARLFQPTGAARAAHAAAARQDALERFSLERMVRDYRTLYDGLLARHDAAAAQAGANG